MILSKREYFEMIERIDKIQQFLTDTELQIHELKKRLKNIYDETEPMP